jgi:hypothetical protein
MSCQALIMASAPQQLLSQVEAPHALRTWQGGGSC